MKRPTPLAIDRVIALDINGSRQRIRICAKREGLPPLVVVQAGPGLPLLHEVAKFQRLLGLEREFRVCYWDQRGCGAASLREARSVSLRQQVEDLRASSPLAAHRNTPADRAARHLAGRYHRAAGRRARQ